MKEIIFLNNFFKEIITMNEKNIKELQEKETEQVNGGIIYFDKRDHDSRKKKENEKEKGKGDNHGKNKNVTW